MVDDSSLPVDSLPTFVSFAKTAEKLLNRSICRLRGSWLTRAGRTNHASRGIVVRPIKNIESLCSGVCSNRS